MAEGELELKKQQSKWQWWEILDREDKGRCKVLKSGKSENPQILTKKKFRKKKSIKTTLLKLLLSTLEWLG